MSLVSCNNSETDVSRAPGKDNRAVNKDGGVTLLLKDADMMEVDSNPQYNTAEWNFVVHKAGRYDVWLSSLTCDTSTNLFAGKVTVTAAETRLEKRPVGDKIITDDKNLKSPWVRAQSHMGSIFFSEPGEYQVQLISDRVLHHSGDVNKVSQAEHTLINSLILRPTVN